MFHFTEYDTFPSLSPSFPPFVLSLHPSLPSLSPFLPLPLDLSHSFPPSLVHSLTRSLPRLFPPSLVPSLAPSFAHLSHYFVYVVESRDVPDTSEIPKVDDNSAYITAVYSADTVKPITVGNGENTTYGRKSYINRGLKTGTQYYIFIRLYSSVVRRGEGGREGEDEGVREGGSSS